MAACPPDRFVGRLLSDLKHAYIRCADVDSALRVQGRIVDLRPDEPGPLQERARLAFQVGQHDAAIRDLESAVAIARDPESLKSSQRQLAEMQRWIAAMRWRTAS